MPENMEGDTGAMRMDRLARRGIANNRQMHSFLEAHLQGLCDESMPVPRSGKVSTTCRVMLDAVTQAHKLGIRQPDGKKLLVYDRDG